MADTEKITINMSVVDLGKIDLLVDQGHYSSRSDLIRTAIREKLAGYDDVVKDVVVRNSFGMGVIGYTKRDLEKKQAQGVMLDISVVGLFTLPRDVSPELALATISSVKVYGVTRVPQAVKTALGDRIR